MMARRESSQTSSGTKKMMDGGEGIAVQDSLPPFSFMEIGDSFYGPLRHIRVLYTVHHTNESFDSISQPVLVSTNGKVVLFLKNSDVIQLVGNPVMLRKKRMPDVAQNIAVRRAQKKSVIQILQPSKGTED